jgi:LPXTG-site transpeptidase (sortase) family protein
MHAKETAAAILAALVLLAGVIVATDRLLTPAAPAMERHIAQPDVKPRSTPKPKPVPVPVATTECPQMTNRGGLRWQRSSDAGPWATGGTVSLPTFGVRAPIVKVGVDQGGHMVVPHNARDVAWLDQGPFPGDTNNAVIAGHISYSRVAGSFSRLQQLRPGEVVTVELDGKRWDFKVTWNCLFDRDTTLAAKIMGRTDVPSLTLISCGGVFDRAAGTHNKRVAVRAELVDA